MKFGRKPAGLKFGISGDNKNEPDHTGNDPLFAEVERGSGGLLQESPDWRDGLCYLIKGRRAASFF
jgi:hypothetical protein